MKKLFRKIDEYAAGASSATLNFFTRTLPNFLTFINPYEPYHKLSCDTTKGIVPSFDHSAKPLRTPLHNVNSFIIPGYRVESDENGYRYLVREHDGHEIGKWSWDKIYISDAIAASIYDRNARLGISATCTIIRAGQDHYISLPRTYEYGYTTDGNTVVVRGSEIVCRGSWRNPLKDPWDVYAAVLHDMYRRKERGETTTEENLQRVR